MPAENFTRAGVTTGDRSAACLIQRRWLKGPLGMVICCGAPLLLIAVISFFGIFSRSNREWGFESSSMSSRDVSDDADDDERQEGGSNIKTVIGRWK